MLTCSTHLTDTPMPRQDARAIFDSALEAVHPKTCIRNGVSRKDSTLVIGDKTWDLDRYEKIILLGMGKAAAAMAAEMEDILGDRLLEGFVIVKYGHKERLRKTVIHEAGHPLPDLQGVEGAGILMEKARAADENTLVICLISGGGSALTPLGAAGITLEDEQSATRVLLECGADIHEINTIRKHISGIKGGLLARAVFPAHMICLAISDVIGDNPDIIASGPASPDPGTYARCIEIIQKYQIADLLPSRVVSHLGKGAKGDLPETPKPGDPVFDNICHTILASNIGALMAAKKKAEALGYNSLILSSAVEGETKDAAAFHAAIAQEVLASGHPVQAPACILSGGETTVTIRGNGKGGRNQEFALACVEKIKGAASILVFSAGTDGTDGPTDAAGAFADDSSFERAKALGLSPKTFLNENDSYNFFKALSDLVITGPTNTNVMDVRILLIR